MSSDLCDNRCTTAMQSAATRNLQAPTRWSDLKIHRRESRAAMVGFDRAESAGDLQLGRTTTKTWWHEPTGGDLHLQFRRADPCRAETVARRPALEDLRRREGCPQQRSRRLSAARSEEDVDGSAKGRPWRGRVERSQARSILMGTTIYDIWWRSAPAGWRDTGDGLAGGGGNLSSCEERNNSRRNETAAGSRPISNSGEDLAAGSEADRAAERRPEAKTLQQEFWQRVISTATMPTTSKEGDAIVAGDLRTIGR